MGAVPAALSAALSQRAYYFVPLAIADTGETMVAPGYTVDLGDRAICHRNANFGTMEAVFLSTRLVEDRFGLAFEFFINVGHNFVEAAGVPESFATLAWAQAEAQVRGETSQDAWETRRRATEGRLGQKNGQIDERARNSYFESAFSDSLAVYMLSLAVDFDYHDLREREYPLLAAPALAERLRHVSALFPAQCRVRFPDSLPAQRLGPIHTTGADGVASENRARRSRARGRAIRRRARRAPRYDRSNPFLIAIPNDRVS